MADADDDVLDGLLGPENKTEEIEDPFVPVEEPLLVEEPEEDVVVDASGAIRSADALDERYDLIPNEPLRRLARVYAYGAKKRGDRNWELGMSGTDLQNRAIRHIQDWAAGREEEPSTPTNNDDDLAHALWNIFALMEFEEAHPDRLLDIPGRRKLHNKLQAKEGTEDGNHTSKDT